MLPTVFFAKRYGLDTRVGARLDPAADKLLMLASPSSR